MSGIVSLHKCREKVECLHGHPVGEDTKVITGCSAVGPPFELQGLTIIPSYGVAVGNKGEDNIKVISTSQRTLFLRSADIYKNQLLWIKISRIWVWSADIGLDQLTMTLI